jgi:hypothetical protein
VEGYVLGIREDDDDVPTADRDFLTPGFRILRAPAPQAIDFEFEAAYQHGTSRLTPLPSDDVDLRHRAFFVHAAVGYSFTGRWSPRLRFMYDYASGDRDPFDDANGRFNTLYGARRFEFGPTGIYGALGRSNLNSPALRLDVHPRRDLHWAAAYRPAWLAEARDFWTTTLLRDPTGSSGTFLGHQIEGAARWWILPGNLALEAGFAYLRLGEFPKQVPGGNPDGGNPTYGYVQIGFQI